MTDIVERLRVYLIGDQLYHPSICSEAADEIERLREENRDLRRPLTGGEDASGWTGADKHNPYRRR